MFEAKHINDLVKHFMEALPPGLTNLPKDLEKNIRAALQTAFVKMDLVTRDEFDAQTKVLERTRLKLEKLEKQLKDLEEQ